MRAPQVVMLGLTLLVAACAGAARPKPRVTPPRWDAMSKEQKHVYMTETVMPEIKAVFNAYDPHRYKKIGCETCHEHGNYAMPSPDLPLEREVAASSSPDKLELFMRDRVATTMARLLGRPTYDCFGCHAVDE